jgi:hypothetical protein
MKTIALLLALFALSVFSIQARTVRLADYGTPDDNIDDSNGFQQAVSDLAGSGGGTLVIGEGIWNVDNPINLVQTPNVTSIRISGNKGAMLKLALNEESTFLSVGNKVQVELSGLVILPKTMGQVYDAGYFLTADYTGQVIIQNCNFFGLYMKYDLIKTTNADLIIEKTLFGGVAARNATIHTVNFSGLTIRDSLFLDYYQFGDTYYSKTPYNAGPWVKAENTSMPTVNAMGTKAVTISSSRFDEGAPIAISVKNAPFVDITDIQVNVSGIGQGHGIRLDNVKFSQIKLSAFGYSPAARPAIVAINNSPFEAVGLRFGNGVYFADADRNNKIYREKCLECAVVNITGSLAEPAAEAQPAPDVKKAGGADNGISKPRVKTLQ